jgi:hypothetical protein
MRRRLLLLGLAAATFALGGGAAQAQGQPTIYLEAGEECSAGTPYGGTFVMSGLEPNTAYMLLIVGLPGPSRFATDAAGNASPRIGAVTSGPFGVTIRIWPDRDGNDSQDPGEPTVLEPHFTVDRPCEDVFPDPVRPTTKAQCKNGGWRDFGVFKNQGDCVSFVATGGKTPPANPSS